MRYSLSLAITLSLTQMSCGGGGGGNTSGASSSLPDQIFSVTQQTSNRPVYIGRESDDDGVPSRFAAMADSREMLGLYYTDETQSPVNENNRFWVDSHDYGQTYRIDYSVLGNDYRSYVYIDEQGSDTVGIVTGEREDLTDLPVLVALGPELTQVPLGTFTYRGGHMVLKPFSGVNVTNYTASNGTFTFIADFSSGRGSMTANATNIRVFDPDVTIDVASGEFNSDNLTLEDRVFNNTYNGQITGTFTGENASGIAGVYSTDGGEFYGAIAGRR